MQHALPTGHNRPTVSSINRLSHVVSRIMLLVLMVMPGLLLAQGTNISFPGFRSSFITGTDLTIIATANAVTGTTVSKVEFLVSSSTAINVPTSVTTVLGEDLTSPYTFTWSILAGQLSYNELRTRVTYASGVTAVSSSVPIDVYEPDVSSTINYYVAPPPLGSTAPANSGTSPASPWSTIQAALQLAKPGDVVNVMAGTYSLASNPTAGNVVTFRRTGTPTNWVTLKNYQNDRPVISFSGPHGIIVLPNVAYAKIQGFEIVGNSANVTLPQAYTQTGSCVGAAGTPPNQFNGNGITLDGRNAVNLHCHHIELRDNIIHDCTGGGISGLQTDYVTVDNNTVYRNCFYTVYGASGISFLNNWNFDSHAGNAPPIIIRNNRSYGNQLFVRWKNGATNTCKTYDGNGIILDNNTATKNALGGYTGRFLIENNLTFQNGGRGININYTDNATIINNTTYQNGVTDAVNSPATGEVTDDIQSEFIAQNSSGISVYNNIFYGRPGEKTIEINFSTVSHGNNLIFEGTGPNPFTGNQNITGQDPLYTDAANGNFQLQANSPAINMGSSVPGQFAATDILGVARPQGTGIDIGAYESTLQPMPVKLSQFSAKPLGNQVSVAWSTANERNSAYFEVQRSGDAREFGEVGRVMSAGDLQATQHYGLLDEKPLVGTSYYRLKQVDRDGTFEYSKIVSVVLDNEQPSFELLGNPLPVNTIRVVTRNLTDATYHLTTMTGQPIDLATQVQANGEFILTPAQILPAGVYLLHARTSSQQLTRKVVVR